MRLYNNQLTQLPGQIRDLTNLSHLYLGRNRLAQIDLSLLPQNPHLRIDLKNNRFSSERVQELNHLQHQGAYRGPRLVLDGVSSVPPVASRVSAFEVGLENWVSERGISDEQRGRRQVAKGRILEAQRQRSQQLSLDNLSLTRLPAEIGQLTELRTLWLHRNKLTQLPAELGHLPDLGRLNLTRNRLEQIDINVLPQNPRLRIDLQHNPLSSECLQELHHLQGQACYARPNLVLGTSATISASDFEAGLDGWVNEVGISSRQARRRERAKIRIFRLLYSYGYYKLRILMQQLIVKYPPIKKNGFS